MRDRIRKFRLVKTFFTMFFSVREYALAYNCAVKSAIETIVAFFGGVDDPEYGSSFRIRFVDSLRSENTFKDHIEAKLAFSDLGAPIDRHNCAHIVGVYNGFSSESSNSEPLIDSFFGA
jgi:hypothetical protein